MPPPTTGQVIGQYELGPQIGEGGMAKVHLAVYRVDTGFTREVCLKLLQADCSGDPDFDRMFSNEAVIAGRLSHPNAVQAFDYNHDGGVWYIAMEYVRGMDLRKAFRRKSA